VDNGNIEERSEKGLYCREVIACDHVGINNLALAETLNFFIQRSGYIVFENNLCKVVCMNCLLKSTDASQLKRNR